MKKTRSRLLLLFSILVILSGLLCLKIWKNRSFDGLAISGGETFSKRIPVDPFFQWDQRWRLKKLGNSSGSMGQYGCTVCATAMALSSQKIPIQPDELNDSLLEHDGFTVSGLLIWKAIEAVSGQKMGIVLEDHPSHALLDRELKNGNPIIAKVLYQNTIWHWVLIAGKEGADYLIHDPLASGQGYEVMGNYPSGIFAVRYLQRL